MAPQKRILVIGGGFSGVGSIKSLKEEGYDPICYEKSSQPGGTWNYRETAPIGLPSIMPTTVINHSKEMGSLTNYIPDKKYPNYMRHYELYELFLDIGEKFDCFRHIVYNREVISVKRSSDYEETGKWNVRVKNTITGEITEETFDVVWVGVGHITYPKIPEYPGMDTFKGTIMHTHSLKKVDMFANKKVLVIGLGCSGVDAAVEISNVASQVYLSSRNGGWLFPRVGPYGLPFDYCMIRRYSNIIQSVMGYKFASWFMQKYQINTKFNHNLYNLNPTFPALCRDPVTNDLLPAKIITGAVAMRKDVKYFTEKGVSFVNEDHVTEVDAVIMATGYGWQFPFLEDGTIKIEDGRINLYKCVFPPHLKHPTLAIIGFLLPMGPGFPLGEMQCRWAAQLISGNCKLPSEEVMMEDIQKRHDENAKRYCPSEKMTVRVDFIPYMDELATEIGAKPNLWKLFFTDFKLYYALVFGASLPYQYRLEGPHKWDGARDAIFTAYKRVRYPLSGEVQKKNETYHFYSSLYKIYYNFLAHGFWLTQNENSVKCYLIALFIPYFMSWNGFYKKWFFSLLMLPFFMTWEGFVSCYMITIFIPIFLASI